MKRLFFLIILLLTSMIHAQGGPFPITITDAEGNDVTINSIDAIVSGSGDVTEIIVALGFEDNLVGVDSSSTYPPYLLDDLPVIGFGRRLTAEPVIAEDPDIFFCTQICGPDDVLDQIRGVGIPVVIIPDNDTGGLDLPFQKIKMVSAALGVSEKGQELADKLALEMKWVEIALANTAEPPAVFHPYLRGRGLQLAAGAGTPGHFMITGAGGHNTAVDAGVEGYAPLSAEIIFAAFPDYLVLTEGNVEASGGLDAILDEQGLRDTPAVENDNVIVMDTQLLLGMSIRTGEALMILAQAFHPEMTWESEVEWPGEPPTRILVTDETLLATVQNLGFHAELYDDAQDIAATDLIVTTEPLDTDAAVIIIENATDIDEIAAALHVPGRGEALKAYLSND
ncbi:MAG: ABC transporter substrate-binding protein [Chloroflexi bacterium]|nr:ABC transporter substrate-binding protein [Chloroflexota bacterium]